jgi:hypothetical protein
MLAPTSSQLLLLGSQPADDARYSFNGCTVKNDLVANSRTFADLSKKLNQFHVSQHWSCFL